MAKTEVYSWRLSPYLKSELAREARVRGMSFAALLESISQQWLSEGATRDLSANDREQRLRQAAMPFVGSLNGGDPDRASQARQRVREKLRRQRAS